MVLRSRFVENDVRTHGDGVTPSNQEIDLEKAKNSILNLDGSSLLARAWGPEKTPTYSGGRRPGGRLGSKGTGPHRKRIGAADLC